jgi:hypothetical protein
VKIVLDKFIIRFMNHTTQMSKLYVSTRAEYDSFLLAHPLAIPDGFKVVGSQTQTKWLEGGQEVARISNDGFGVTYEIAANG